MQYLIVFDVAQAGFKGWPFLLAGLGLAVVGIVYVMVFTIWIKKRYVGIFGGVLLLIGLLTVSETYRHFSSFAQRGQAQVVEGKVSAFHPMPVNGHAMETFCVQQRCFSYSDYVLTPGFNNTSSHGGPIRLGLAVRVTYVGDTIVKLEIAP